MANLVLVYGMRLLPADDLAEVPPAVVELKGGRQARITLHILEGARRRSRPSCAPAWRRSSTSIRKSDRDLACADPAL